MKRKFSVLLVFSGIQILIAALLLMNFPIPASAGSAWTWCDAGCGGCGIIGFAGGACGHSECDYCFCVAIDDDGNWYSFVDDCPEAIPE